MNVTLRPVQNTDAVFLFDLLLERRPWQSISHREMPTFEQHKAFMDRQPYAHWYIIIADDEEVGHTYLTNQNEVGIFLTKNRTGRGIAVEAAKLLMQRHPGKRFLANVNPQNEPSTKFFRKLGFKHVQNTYELLA